MAVTGQPFCKSVYGGMMMYFKHFIEFQMSLFIANLVINVAILVISFFNAAFGALWYVVCGGTDAAWIGALIGWGFGGVCGKICLGQFDEAINGTLQSMAFDEEVNGEICFGPKSFQEKLEEMEKELAAEEAAKNGAQVANQPM